MRILSKIINHFCYKTCFRKNMPVKKFNNMKKKKLNFSDKSISSPRGRLSLDNALTKVNQEG